MRILFLPNWRVHSLAKDDSVFQAPDKLVKGQPYWFFKYFTIPCKVDIIDFQQKNWLTFFEKKLNFYIWQSLKAFWVSRRYDVVVSHGAQSGLVYALLNIFRLDKRPVHVIFDIGAMNGGRKHWLENALIRLALLSKPYVICHSKVIIENYRHTYPGLDARACFVPFGVDVEDFVPPQVGKAHSAEYVLSFGSAKRDYPTLLKAWGGIRTETKLRIIGQKKSETAALNVEFIEKVSISELKDQIANALFVVIPLPVFSYSYGQMSFLQSMSMGKTVVVTKTPSSVDYIQHGQGAFYVSPSDAEGLRERISYLLNDSNALKASDALARNYVLMHFTEQMMAEQVQAWLERVCKNEGVSLG